MEPEVKTINTNVIETKRDDLKKVDPRNIIVEPEFNVRNDMGDIEGLAHSVVTDGVIVPIEGYKVRGEDKYVLTDGHRRMLAVNLALKYHAEGKKGFEDISKIELIRLIPSSPHLKDRLYIMAITGEKKKDLTDLEKATMYSRLLEIAVAEGKKKGEAIKEICARLSISQATFYNIHKLNELPEEIKDSITNGEISGSTVVTIVRDVKDAETQKKMVAEAIVEAKAAVKEGGKAKKATAKDVKGLKAKTPIQKLKKVVEKLQNLGATNTRANALIKAMELIEEGKSVNAIFELFV